MPNPPISDEALADTVEAYNRLGSISAVSRELGLTRSSIQNRMKNAERRGMTGRTPPAPAGFEVRGLSEQLDASGNVKGKSVRYGPEIGPRFEMPAGRVMGKSTVQVGPDGNIEREWIRHQDGPTLENTVQLITDAFAGFQPFAPAIWRRKDHDEDRLTVYALADWHVGLFSYGREIDGPDWDLAIARKVLAETFAELVEQTPPSQHAIVLGLGDLMHADSPKNQTPGSGNILDVDTRYSKCLPTVCDLVAQATENVRQKHKHVEVAIKGGNHDPASTVGIRAALRMYYRNDDRVTVDDSPSPYYWKRFGVNLICGTHGDGCKPQDIPLLMANIRARDWADTISRHAHTGHEHHERTKEIGGVKVHTHRAPITSDAWHHAQGYRSGRSMAAFHYHVSRGARGKSEVEIL